MTPMSNFDYGFKPGTIFVREFCSDGGDRASFYKVTKVTPHFLTLVSIGATHVTSDQVVPDPAREYGLPFRRKVQDHGVPGREAPCVGTEYYGTAHPWDGTPCMYDLY